MIRCAYCSSFVQSVAATLRGKILCDLNRNVPFMQNIHRHADDDPIVRQDLN